MDSVVDQLHSCLRAAAARAHTVRRIVVEPSLDRGYVYGPPEPALVQAHSGHWQILMAARDFARLQIEAGFPDPPHRLFGLPVYYVVPLGPSRG